MKVLIEVSARHCHLSREDLEALFGVGYNLSKRNDLTVPGSFAAKETVTLQVGGGCFERVRAVGPLRKQTQVEISLSDANFLGMNLPRRLSGDLTKSAGGKLIGPAGSVVLKEGIILAQKHLHGDKKLLNQLGLVDGDVVAVEVVGVDGFIFKSVIVRSLPKSKLIMHIDVDEAMLAGIDGCAEGIIRID